MSYQHLSLDYLFLSPLKQVDIDKVCVACIGIKIINLLSDYSSSSLKRKDRASV